MSEPFRWSDPEGVEWDVVVRSPLHSLWGKKEEMLVIDFLKPGDQKVRHTAWFGGAEIVPASTLSGEQLLGYWRKALQK